MTIQELRIILTNHYKLNPQKDVLNMHKNKPISCFYVFINNRKNLRITNSWLKFDSNDNIIGFRNNVKTVPHKELDDLIENILKLEKL